MNKIATLSVILFAMIFTLSSFKVSESEAATGPKIQFEKTTHDFGEVPFTTNSKEFVTYNFVFENTGDEPLSIDNVRASCGCTTPSYPKEPILPGQTGKIKVKYKNNRKGAFHKSITVYSNTNPKTTTLFIKGTVVQESSGNPVQPQNSSAPSAK